MAAKPKPKATNNAGSVRAQGGFNPTINLGAGANGLPNPNGQSNGSQFPQATTGTTSSRLYKGGTAEVGLTSLPDAFAAANQVYQQLLGRNATPDEIQSVLSAVNAQEYVKGGADVATAQAQQQAYVEAITGGNEGAATRPASSGAPGAGAGGAATAQQVYNEALALGGTVMQAQVAASLVSGIESNGSPTELAGGIGPAQGLFQFEPGTWTGSAGGGKNGLPGTVGAATWQQQVQGFLNASRGDNFGAWGPDLVTNAGNPNSTSNPNYGYSGAPQAGSKVGNVIAANAKTWAAGVGTGTAGLTPAQGASLASAVAEGGGAYLSALAAKQPGSQAGGPSTPGITQNPIPSISPLGPGQGAASETVGQNVPFKIGNTVQYVEAPTATVVTAPSSATAMAEYQAETQHPAQFQEQNLMNVFNTIQQMLGTPKAPMQSALPVP